MTEYCINIESLQLVFVLHVILFIFPVLTRQPLLEAMVTKRRQQANEWIVIEKVCVCS